MKRRFFGFCITLPVVLSGAALAQDAADSGAASAGLEEIVVTAQKRAENVQEVPIAVTAVTAEALESKNISSVQGLTNITPNVTLDAGSPFSGSTSVLTAYVRGIGQDDFAFNLDPGVGVYVDGVYLARTVGANTDLLDVERIEVLKGPQGTLFGRNSIGGAISIVTRDPSNEYGGRAEVRTGRYNAMELRGIVDLPIAANKLLSSLSFSSVKKDGYVKRIPYPTAGLATDPPNAYPRAGYASSTTEGGENQWTLRGKLLWKGDAGTRVTVSGDYQKVDQSGMANTLLRVLSNNGAPSYPGELFGSAYNLCINVPNNFLPSGIGSNIQALCGVRGTIGTSFGNANVDADPNNDRPTFDNRFISSDKDKTYATGPSFSQVKNWGLAAIVDQPLGDDVNLKSITAYRELDWLAAMDVDGTPITIVEPGFQMHQEQFSEELQLSGKAFTNRLDYVLGAYYFEERGNLHDYVPFGGGLLQVDGNNTFDTDAWAVFTHLNYRLSDLFSVTVGGRYTKETKRFEGFQRDPNGFLYKLVLGKQLVDITEADRIALGFPDPNDPLRFYPPGENEKSFSNFSPRVGFEVHPTQDVMIYASYSQGYKTGGWTTRLSAPESTAPDFAEEKADSYELGMKSEMLDHHLRANLAGFYTLYKGIQLTQTNGISPTTRNAGDATIYGVEGEMQAVVSDAFLLSGSVGYVHDEYTRKLPGTTAGDRLPKTPRLKLNLSPRYTVHVGNDASIVTNVDYTYTSSLFNNTENTPELERDAVSMLNASLTYQAHSDAWSLTAGGTNLLNERYLTTGQFQPGGGIIYGTYSRPVEWYFKLGLKF
jgi:iron complex outermembrane receptor protein